MKARFLLLWQLLLVGLIYCQSAGAVEQVVLVQNSGWMDPFYNDPESRLKPLIAALVRQTATAENAIHVASFNERTPDSPSPTLLYSGQANGFSESLLKDLTIGTKKSGAWADTNMIEAIAVAVREYLQNRSGVIWLLTNNRNSPDNDQRTAERNREFYALLHESPHISRTIAFPVRMPLQGARYESSGLMVYALAYGEAAGLALKQMVDSGVPQALRFIRPARLKPLDQDSVVIEPKDIEPPEVDVTPGPDGRSFVFDLDAALRPDAITLNADVRNLFFPYRIDSARLEYAFTDDKGRPLQIRSDPVVLSDIGPGESARVSFTVQVPVESIPSRWSAQSFAALGDTIQIPATLRVRLADQRLSIDPSFTKGIGELFPDDPISEVFER